MKLIIKLSLAFLITLRFQICFTQKNFVPLAIQKFVENYYVENSIKFEIIYNSKVVKLLDASLKLISDLKPYRVTQIENEGKDLYKLRHSAVLLFDKFENYLRFEDRIDISENGAEISNFFVVCANLSVNEVQTLDSRDNCPMTNFKSDNI